MSSAAGENERAQSELLGLDLSGIRFPSDKLTIADLRRLRPEFFDQGFDARSQLQPQYFFEAEQVGHAANDIGILLMCERQVAIEAYAKVRGIVEATGWHVRDLRAGLRQQLRRFELCRGKHDADEMIRDIERQAALLAKQKGR